MYRGDKDFRLGMELCKDPGVRYTALVPSVSSPMDSKLLEDNLTRNQIPGNLPANMSIEFLKSRLIFFNRKNTSLGGTYFQLSTHYPQIIKKLKPDLIFESPYTTLTPRSYATGITAKITEIPLVYVDSGDIPPKGVIKRIINRMEGKIIRFMKHTITYNEMGKQRFIKEYNCADCDISVIPKPIDVNQFSPKINGLSVREHYNSESQFLVSYIGRLSKNKGPAVLLEAAKKLKALGLERDYQFLFVGGNIDSAESKELIDYTTKHKLHNVHFTGKIKHHEMAQHQAASNIIVYPNLINNPGFPTVLAESMAMGKAIILGIKGFEGATPIRDGVNGRVVSAGDSDEILTVIQELSEDPGQVRKYEDAVRKYAVEQMDWNKVAKKYYQIFKEACR